MGNAHFEEEGSEFRITAKELGINLKQILQAVKKAKLVTLTDKMWQNMQNTESWHVKDMKEVKSITKKYNKNVESIINAVENGDTLPAPIILAHKGYYLIAGNTRLMVAKVTGIRPKVLLVKLPN